MSANRKYSAFPINVGSCSDLPVDLLADLAESVAYRRLYVPEDGVRLSELVELACAASPSP